jgi:hypothetical protein
MSPPTSGSKNKRARNQRESRWRRYVPPKRGLTFYGLHGVMSQKIELFIFCCYSLSICNIEKCLEWKFSILMRVCIVSSLEERTPKRPQIGQLLEKDFCPVVKNPLNSYQLICIHWKHFSNILSHVRMTVDAVLDWRLDLLSTYTLTTLECTF